MISYLNGTKNFNLPMYVGTNEEGEFLYDDLVKVPHILLLGDSFSGKSNYILGALHSISKIKTKEECKFLLIDTSFTNLHALENSKNLLRSIVNDPGQAIDCLQGLLNEIKSRFIKISKLGVRNIEQYNEIENLKIPYIICVIDEIADVILKDKEKVETLLGEIISMGRSVGVHCIISTKHKMSEVLTERIKTLFPSFMLFKTNSTDGLEGFLGGLDTNDFKELGEHYYKIDDIGIQKLKGYFFSEEEISKSVKK